MKIEQIVSEKSKTLISVKGNTQVSAIYETMKKNNIHQVAVVENETFQGIVDQEILLEAIMLSPSNFHSLEAANIMRKNTPKLQLDDTIESLIEAMKDENLTSIPCFDGDKCVNLVTRSDVLRFVSNVLMDDDGLFDQAVAKGELALAHPISRRIMKTLSDLGI